MRSGSRAYLVITLMSASVSAASALYGLHIAGSSPFSNPEVKLLVILLVLASIMVGVIIGCWLRELEAFKTGALSRPSLAQEEIGGAR